jgi:hypothetical protein
LAPDSGQSRFLRTQAVKHTPTFHNRNPTTSTKHHQRRVITRFNVKEIVSGYHYDTQCLMAGIRVKLMVCVQKKYSAKSHGSGHAVLELASIRRPIGTKPVRLL